MPGTKTVLSMIDDSVFAEVLQAAIPAGFRILEFQGEIRYQTHAFFVVSTKTPDWPQLVHRLTQAGEKVVVVFAHPSPAGQKTASDLGAVILFADDSEELVRITLYTNGLI